MERSNHWNPYNFWAYALHGGTTLLETTFIIIRSISPFLSSNLANTFHPLITGS